VLFRDEDASETARMTIDDYGDDDDHCDDAPLRERDERRTTRVG